MLSRRVGCAGEEVSSEDIERELSEEELSLEEALSLSEEGTAQEEGRLEEAIGGTPQERRPRQAIPRISPTPFLIS